MAVVIGIVVVVLVLGAAGFALTKRGPSLTAQWETAASAAGLTYEASSPATFGKARGDVRGHAVREVANVVTGRWKGRAVTAFEATCGVEPNRTQWFVITVSVEPEPRPLTVTRNDQLITFVLRQDQQTPFTTPAQASESDELRRMASRLNFPLRLACDDDVAGRERLAPHFEFLQSTDPQWVYQSTGGEVWFTTPPIVPGDLQRALDAAVAATQSLELLRRPWNYG